jgi:DNA-binding HxlR family transcriptional regulator
MNEMIRNELAASQVLRLVDSAPQDRLENLDRLLQLLERRWALMIVSRLCMRPMRFSELLRAIPLMSPKMMLDRLAELEHHGIVGRISLSEASSRAKYTLTSAGQELQPAVHALLEWARSRGLN